MSELLEMPSLPPTRRRVITTLATIMEAKQLDRWYCEVMHAGPAGHWITDHRWISTSAPTPDVMSEIETAVINPLETEVMRRWGVQSLLL